MSKEEEDLGREPDDERTVAAAAGGEAVDVMGDTASLEVQDGDAASYDSQGDVNDFGDAEDDDDDDDDDEEEEDVVIHDADAEDAAEKLAVMRREMAERGGEGGTAPGDDDVAPGGSRSMSELISIIESLIFVSEEPLPAKTLAEVLKEDRGWVQVAVEELAKEFNERNGGLMLREVAGGWQFATRPENHEYVRAFLKSRPSAKLSLAALETLAVIAYKQPITVPEILEIRGVQSSSAIKTLLDKRLIISKGRKETVGRPMMYGTSKEFLLQFGLRDLSELPNVEDFEDLATGGA
ncbi:MAG TPA: SMC-Scp complex subunit ScpB [Pyrinomonadaceae bacterium]|nr:SMC-Scp complex subunit ScpB [Pyrinomonadaceae bacterium]